MDGTKEFDKVLLSTGKTLTVPTISQDNNESDDTVVIEKVQNVWGSSSGAGSDFLDKYRKGRNIELQRLEEMDRRWKEEMENKLFHSQRLHRIQKENNKTMKRKLKRDKRKQKNIKKILNQVEQNCTELSVESGNFRPENGQIDEDPRDLKRPRDSESDSKSDVESEAECVAENDSKFKFESNQTRKMNKFIILDKSEDF